MFEIFEIFCSRDSLFVSIYIAGIDMFIHSSI